MKVLEPTVEVIKQEDFSIKSIKQFIERCARLSYKSEDKMTDESYQRFVEMLIEKDHARPLEFGTVHLKMNLDDFSKFIVELAWNGLLNCIWMKWNQVGDMYYITTNYRYFSDICKSDCPVSVEHAFAEEDNEYYPKRYTAKFVVSRGVMDEFRTHISLSSIAESTRWCNYSKGKFNNELSVVLPRSLYNTPEVDVNYITWKLSLIDAENAYMELLNMGWTPQHARGVLPLDLKSELIMCGFKDAWDNFFYRRYAIDAHPDAQYIANKLRTIIYE